MILDKIALILAIIGGLNWGSIGLFQFDFVAALFGARGPGGALVHFAPVPRHPRQGIKSQGPLNKRALTFFTLCHILHPRGVLTA